MLRGAFKGSVRKRDPGSEQSEEESRWGFKIESEQKLRPHRLVA